MMLCRIVILMVPGLCSPWSSAGDEAVVTVGSLSEVVGRIESPKSIDGSVNLRLVTKSVPFPGYCKRVVFEFSSNAFAEGRLELASAMVSPGATDEYAIALSPHDCERGETSLKFFDPTWTEGTPERVLTRFLELFQRWRLGDEVAARDLRINSKRPAFNECLKNDKDVGIYSFWENCLFSGEADKKRFTAVFDGCHDDEGRRAAAYIDFNQRTLLYEVDLGPHIALGEQ